jgi:hypothetical protein
LRLPPVSECVEAIDDGTNALEGMLAVHSYTVEVE